MVLDNNRRAVIKSIGAAGLVGLAGCSEQAGQDTPTQSDDDSSDGAVTDGQGQNFGGDELHIVTEMNSDNAREMWSNVTSAFADEYNVSVNVEHAGLGAPLNQRVTQLLQAGNPPEILVTGQQEMSEFQNAGAVAPVTELVADRVPSLVGEPLQQFTYQRNGEHWFVPLMATAATWNWRQDIADELGFSESEMYNATWETALEFAQTVEDSEDHDMRGTYVPAGTGTHVNISTTQWMYTNGGQIIHWEGDKVAVAYDEGENRQKMIETLEYITDRQQYSPNAPDSSYGSWYDSIPNEVAASSQYMGFRVPRKAVEYERDFSHHIRVSQPPSSTEGGPRTSTASGQGFVTFNGANTEVAKAFMEFVLSDSERLLDFFTASAFGHYTPVYPEIQQGDIYQGAIEALEEPPWHKENFAAYQEEIIPNSKTRVTNTDPPHSFGGAFFGSGALSNLRQDVLLNDRPPAEAIDRWAPEHQAAFDEAQS